jgi:hypothetical protein
MGGGVLMGALDTIAERFWRKVCVGSPDECWEWLGSKTDRGYGRINIEKVTYRAHRLAMLLAGKELPESSLACHRCDNPGCVNPAHLFAGSSADNINDCIAKGRWPSRVGEASPRALLSEAVVREIRRSTEPHTVLARKLGVSPHAIRNARSRKTWSHVE